MKRKKAKKAGNKSSRKGKGLFFIVGRGRSGTWLLQSMLNTHPGVCVAPEGMFVMNLHRKYRRKKAWNKKDSLEFYNDLWKERRLSQWWSLDRKKLKKELLETDSRKGFAERCMIVYSNQAEAERKKDALLLGDKNPTYTLFIEELMSIFPKARFVCMTRDYRDNILSFKKVSFDLNSTAGLARRWKDYNKRILGIAEKHPGRTMLLRFEDLLEKPEKELKRVCSFLGIGYDRTMLEFHKNPKHVFEWTKKLSSPVDPGRAGIWKKGMSSGEVRTAECICGKTGEEMGYKKKFRPCSVLIRIKSLPGCLLGLAFTIAEKSIFLLPLGIREKIINTYRKLDKSCQ